MIANKLANELIQSAIDFFNKKNNGVTNDVALKAYEICKYAKSIVVGGQTKERVDIKYDNADPNCDDNLEIPIVDSQQGKKLNNLKVQIYTF